MSPNTQQMGSTGHRASAGGPWLHPLPQTDDTTLSPSSTEAHTQHGNETWICSSWRTRARNYSVPSPGSIFQPGHSGPSWGTVLYSGGRCPMKSCVPGFYSLNATSIENIPKCSLGKQNLSTEKNHGFA